MEKLRRLAKWIGDRGASPSSNTPISPGRRSGTGPYRARPGDSPTSADIAVLHDAKGMLLAFTADASCVYFAEGSILYRLTPEATKPEKLATTKDLITNLTVDDDSIYVACTRSLWRAPKRGGDLTHLAERFAPGFTRLAACGSHLVWLTSSVETDPTNDKLVIAHHSAVVTLPLGAKEPETLAYRQHMITDIFADRACVRWVEARKDGRALMSVPLSGGAPSEVLRVPRASMGRSCVAMSDSLVFAADEAARHILMTPRRGGPWDILATLDASPLTLAAKGEALYAIAGNRTKRRREALRISPSTGAVELLARLDAQGRRLGGGYPAGELAASDAGLFLCDGARLLRISKDGGLP